jgi:homotetrameric cytidine deaminase
VSISQADRELIDHAVAARERAHAPFSGFPVGAAVRLADGRMAVGVNVENSSFGLTVCAERNAVAAAVAGGALPGEGASIAIAAEGNGPTPPCGACRQVLADFASDDARIILHDVRTGETTETTLGALLPDAFRADNIPKR